MILAAALLVLLGLGLFVGGILTGTTVFYWLCVVACVAAGVFLVLARVRMGRAPSRAGGDRPAAPAAPGTQQRRASSGAGTGATAAGVADGSPGGMPAAGPVHDPVPDATPAWERTASLGWEPAVAPVGDPAAPPAAEPVPAGLPPTEPPSTAAHAPRGASRGDDGAGNPPVEEVEVTDLLLVVDLRDEVLVVDEHPRYHVGGCRWLAGRETIPLPVDEARTDGFTPCAWCEPDRTLAERERGRRTGRGA